MSKSETKIWTLYERHRPWNTIFLFHFPRPIKNIKHIPTSQFVQIQWAEFGSRFPQGSEVLTSLASLPILACIHCSVTSWSLFCSVHTLDLSPPLVLYLAIPSSQITFYSPRFPSPNSFGPQAKGSLFLEYFLHLWTVRSSCTYVYLLLNKYLSSGMWSLGEQNNLLSSWVWLFTD